MMARSLPKVAVPGALGTRHTGVLSRSVVLAIRDVYPGKFADDAVLPPPPPTEVDDAGVPVLAGIVSSEIGGSAEQLHSIKAADMMIGISFLFIHLLSDGT